MLKTLKDTLINKLDEMEQREKKRNEIINYLSHNYHITLFRLKQTNSFALTKPDGTRDPNNAVARLIPHPDNPIAIFGENDLSDEVKRMVWCIYSSDREEYLNHDGYWQIVKETSTYMDHKTKKIIKHQIPFWETQNEMFECYLNHCKLMGWIE